MSKDVQEEISIRDILLKIRNQEIDPSTLNKETRQSCVESLVLDGQQQSSIAQFLKKSDRTIRRDLEEIRKGYSVKRDSGNSIIAEFIFNSKINISYLMRLARSSEGSLAEKARAEGLAFKVNKEVIQELCFLGLLYFNQEKEKIITETKENEPQTEAQKEIVDSIRAIGALERDILVECLLRADKGLAYKSKFIEADSTNGLAILDSLIKNGVLEECSSSYVRLKRMPGQIIERPKEILGSNFDLVWEILNTPQRKEADEKAKVSEQEKTLV